MSTSEKDKSTEQYHRKSSDSVIESGLFLGNAKDKYLQMFYKRNYTNADVSCSIMVLNSVLKEIKSYNLFRCKNKKIMIILNIVSEKILKSKSLDLKLNDEGELMSHSRIISSIQKLQVEVVVEEEFFKNFITHRERMVASHTSRE